MRDRVCVVVISTTVAAAVSGGECRDFGWHFGYRFGGVVAPPTSPSYDLFANNERVWPVLELRGQKGWAFGLWPVFHVERSISNRSSLSG